jgi:hypothetical protein
LYFIYRYGHPQGKFKAPNNALCGRFDGHATAEVLSSRAERFHDSAHIGDNVDALRESHVLSGGLVHEQVPPALVQDAGEGVVQDHLRQLALHCSYREVDELRDVCDLHATASSRARARTGTNRGLELSRMLSLEAAFVLILRHSSLATGHSPVRVDDLQKIGLEHVVIEDVQVVCYQIVCLQIGAVLVNLQRFQPINQHQSISISGQINRPVARENNTHRSLELL